jgi:hypothetical protein
LIYPKENNMFARASKLVFGVLATTFVVGAAGTALAHPWPGPQPWPTYHPYHYHYGPVVYVNPAPVVYSVNPVPASIRLANPNQVALSYTLNGGAVQVLPAGSAVMLDQTSVIAFDRGGALGWNRYTLTSGAYKFMPSGGAWTLVRDVPETPIVAASNPLPPATP